MYLPDQDGDIILGRAILGKRGDGCS